ncbi:hypothetical protein RFI_16825 [Reticulomyxa filosa]|uniref:Uncharacterized protein n=1 Tax=Reticulomyxa filosa TaxID=46433 RepID=X6N524_RETFI|nr:hypothetical protein RFI_16825 [Reticulomyxa filosa]|eukprot:ETO20392.1 hypothetical protein RFI_16825 [Reticulomyxa filosa]
MFLSMHIVTSAIPFVPFLFGKNIWPYFGLSLLMGLNGSNNSSTPIMNAYVADILPAHLRTMGYSLMYLAGGIGLLLGSVPLLSQTFFFFYTCCIKKGPLLIFLAYSLYYHCLLVVIALDEMIGAATSIILGNLWGDVAIVVAMLLLYFTQLVLLIIYLQESLPETRHQHKINRSANPISPLLRSRENPIVFWTSVIQFLISLPETGVLDTIIPYILDQLEKNDTKEANTLTGLFLVDCALGMMFGSVLYLFIFSFFLLRKKNTVNIPPSPPPSSENSYQSINLYNLFACCCHHRHYFVMIDLFATFLTSPTIFRFKHSVNRYITDLDVVVFGGLYQLEPLYCAGAIVWIWHHLWNDRLFRIQWNCFPLFDRRRARSFCSFPHSQKTCNNFCIGFGIVFAWRSLTFCIAPFSFAAMYKGFKAVGFPAMPYIIATLMCLCAVPIITNPLAKILAITPDTEKKLNSAILHRPYPSVPAGKTIF